MTVCGRIGFRLAKRRQRHARSGCRKRSTRLEIEAEQIVWLAPSWLLDFCNASVDCFAQSRHQNTRGTGHASDLGDLSIAREGCGRDGLREANDAWPDLPKGTIGAGRPIPKPNPWFADRPPRVVDRHTGRT
jgi:hypothetical protein